MEKNSWEVIFQYKKLPVVPITKEPVNIPLKDKEIIIEPNPFAPKPCWGSIYLVEKTGKVLASWIYTP